jgi:hypothetical protein
MQLPHLGHLPGRAEHVNGPRQRDIAWRMSHFDDPFDNGCVRRGATAVVERPHIALVPIPPTRSLSEYPTRVKAGSGPS